MAVNDFTSSKGKRVLLIKCWLWVINHLNTLFFISDW